MLKPHTIFVTFVLLILSITNAQAQGDTARSDRPEAPTITASASGERVRFTAPPSIVQTRLEVYDSTGKKVFDNEVRGGNVLDWRLQDGQAAPLADDTYLCAITVKSLAGKITQRIGSVTIQKGTASVRAADASQMTAQQSQAIGPVDENPSLSVVTGDETLTTTVVAHNGEEGQITRGRGALSFRLGDFYGGKDTEQMRLTPEGNVGIGISHPRARLDVDGLIRTNQGIVFPDGSVQTTAASSASGGAAGGAAGGNQGGGKLFTTTNPMASSGKDGKGKNKVSPEFNVNEDLTVNGNIIFTPALNRDITMQQNIGGIRIFAGPTLTTSPSSAAIQFFGNGHAGFPGQAYIDSGAHNSAAVIFRTAQTGGTITERMRVNALGNVGIGTPNPQQHLSVNGALNVDQAGLSNGALNPGLTFGSMSGEGISSKRTAGGTGFGLDFYTNSTNRISISNSGNVGIGTPSPGFKLDVADRMRVRKGGSGDAGIWFFQTGPNNDRAFVGMQNDTRVGLFGNSGAGWGLTMDTTNGDLSLSAALSVDAAGLNGGALYPGISFGNVLGSTGEGIASRRSAGGNQFGLDFFTGFASRMSISNSGDVNITGNLAANNLPGVRSNQTHCDNLGCVITVTPGGSYTADTIAVSVPAAGFLFISAFANISNLGNPFFDVEFNLFQCADINCNSSTLLSSTNPKAAVSSAHISWVIPVTGSGFVFLRTSGVSHNSSNDVHIFDHSLTAIYLPKGY